MYSETFIKCLPIIFKHEGYRSDDKGDPGKLTIWGISSAYYPNEVAEMDKMTPEKAKDVASDIYYKNYWLPLGCDDYESKLALIIFNLGENCGTGAVKEWLVELQLDLTIDKLLLRCVEYKAKRCNEHPEVRPFLLGWINMIIDLWKTDLSELE